jgi:ATP-dependent RNA helicase SUPV3L1/SUV3
MGLNMDVDCVAFADLRKFDGRKLRDLEDAELAQVAGRAGRHHNNGKFVTLAPLSELPPSTVRAIEDHRFPAQTQVFWRNSDLDVQSLASLTASLARRPPHACLELVTDADDTRALARLSDDAEIAARCRSSKNVELLWQVCQIPDFRQLQLDDHFKLLRAVFLQLSGPRGRLEKDWIARHLQRLSDLVGDIDTLLARMAFIRTWTYITHHTRWLDDARSWQEQARALEDSLSDALHARLVARFVDAGSKRGRTRTPARGGFADQLRNAVAQGSGETLSSTGTEAWVDELIEASGDRFGLGEDGEILGDGRMLGHMSRGNDRLHPEVTVTLGELGPGAKLRLQRRMVAWARDLAETLLAPLRDPHLAKLSPAARGIIYQLEQGLGTALASDAREQLGRTDQADRSRLGRAGIKLGRRVLYALPLLQPEAILVRAAFCRAYLGRGNGLGIPAADTAFFLPSADVDDDTCLALGFPVVAGAAVRADEIEFLIARLAAGARPAFIARRLGCDAEVATGIALVLSNRDRRR